MKSKAQLAKEIAEKKTAKQMQDFLEGNVIEQKGLEEAFDLFLQDKKVSLFLNWSITDPKERKEAVKYLAKFAKEFIEWVKTKSS